MVFNGCLCRSFINAMRKLGNVNFLALCNTYCKLINNVIAMLLTIVFSLSGFSSTKI